MIVIISFLIYRGDCFPDCRTSRRSGKTNGGLRRLWCIPHSRWRPTTDRWSSNGKTARWIRKIEKCSAGNNGLIYFLYSSCLCLCDKFTKQYFYRANEKRHEMRKSRREMRTESKEREWTRKMTEEDKTGNAKGTNVGDEPTMINPDMALEIIGE